MAFTHGIRLRALPCNWTACVQFAPAEAAFRRGSETDLDEQIVRKEFALVYPAARVLIGHERHP
jgi:hypothetical protein